MTMNFIRQTQQMLLNKKTLKNTGMTKTAVNRMLADYQWKKKISRLVENGDYSSEGLLAELKPMLDILASEPEQGWLSYICDVTTAYMYPDKFLADTTEERQRAAYLLSKVHERLRTTIFRRRISTLII